MNADSVEFVQITYLHIYNTYKISESLFNTIFVILMDATRAKYARKSQGRTQKNIMMVAQVYVYIVSQINADVVCPESY